MPCVNKDGDNITCKYVCICNNCPYMDEKCEVVTFDNHCESIGPECYFVQCSAIYSLIGTNFILEDNIIKCTN